MTVSTMMKVVTSAGDPPPQKSRTKKVSLQRESCGICNGDVSGYGQIDKSCTFGVVACVPQFNDENTSSEMLKLA